LTILLLLAVAVAVQILAVAVAVAVCLLVASLLVAAHTRLLSVLVAQDLLLQGTLHHNKVVTPLFLVSD
jgi:hypothetical protein